MDQKGKSQIIKLLKLPNADSLLPLVLAYCNLLTALCSLLTANQLDSKTYHLIRKEHTQLRLQKLVVENHAIHEVVENNTWQQAR